MVFRCQLAVVPSALLVQARGFGIWRVLRFGTLKKYQRGDQQHGRGGSEGEFFGNGPLMLSRSLAFDGFAGVEQFQVEAHFCGGLVTLARVALTGLDDNFVELEQRGVFGPGLQIGRQLRKFMAIFAEADFVKHFAQAEDVGLRRAGTFGRNVARGSHHRTRFVYVRYQTDVG